MRHQAPKTSAPAPSEPPIHPVSASEVIPRLDVISAALASQTAGFIALEKRVKELEGHRCVVTGPPIAGPAGKNGKQGVKGDRGPGFWGFFGGGN